MEEARFAYMKEEVGIDYSDMEKSGILFLVLSVNAKYIKSAVYGDEITVNMKIVFNNEPRILFRYLLYNDKNEKLLKASIVIGYFSLKTNRIMFDHPKWLIKKIEDKFKGYNLRGV